MTAVFVGIGSNRERERRIREAVAALRRRFGSLRLSPVYESAAVGFSGSPFYNLVAAFDCDLPARQLLAALRAIEQACGRDPAAAKFAPRPLDLDLLLYGDLVLEAPDLRLPRADILTYGFVLKPLADLAPAGRHPVLGRSYADLWAAFDGAGRELQRVQLPGLMDD
ncbi:MAG TPA: 2-amino-4-hydroxy-6-hydroxymethyldihydropteridine diphosphokinase [Nevskiales bacterium]|nr:2-amino-4-hydroxy-6-hydroxymethyldihydropteridine diphosphokinase [Nevskiales bacterium]